jgi:hypothetical protein
MTTAHSYHRVAQAQVVETVAQELPQQLQVLQ